MKSPTTGCTSTPGYSRLDRGGRVAQRLLAHVERHEARERARVAHRVEQDPRLLRRSRAELDERVGAGDARDLRRPRLEDRPLAASRVVLGQARDLVEQLPSRGRRRTTSAGCPSASSAARARRRTQRVAEVVGGEVHVDAWRRRVRLVMSVPRAVAVTRPPRGARRRTSSGSRAGRSCGTSARACPTGVMRAPPRSVICPLMNLPLYSPTAPAAGVKRGYGRYALRGPLPRHVVEVVQRSRRERAWPRAPTRTRSAGARRASARTRRPRSGSRARPARSDRRRAGRRA